MKTTFGFWTKYSAASYVCVRRGVVRFLRPA
ncbi:MAG: hypothetical protein FJ118_12880 [Deltaproteobacteria bacterium]|nr:hypothetical protein [Deltaproteobacteria bacterium]